MKQHYKILPLAISAFLLGCGDNQDTQEPAASADASAEELQSIARDAYGSELESNWLPAPEGPFYAVLRLYLPEESVLEGQWTPPKLVKADWIGAYPPAFISFRISSQRSSNEVRSLKP